MEKTAIYFDSVSKNTIDKKWKKFIPDITIVKKRGSVLIFSHSLQMEISLDQ